MRIGVTISRDWDDYEAIPNALLFPALGLDRATVTVVHGAYHMDWFVAGIAYAFDMHTEPHPPNWGKHGRAAGPIRNQEMVDSGADIWLAWIKNGSRGATCCATLADEAGIPVWRYRR